MKKFLASTLAVSLFAIAAPSAQAAVVNGNFNVTANLTATCTIAPIADLAFGTYTAFQVAAIAVTTPVSITCTRGLAAPTYAFDAANGGSNGVIAGLNYSLTAALTATAPGSAATPGVAGTADVRTVTISGDMPGLQAGDSAAATTQVRTITVTY